MLQITKGGCMAKRLFLVLLVLFIFSLLFVQVSEADGPAPGTYSLTVDQIGFYSTMPSTSPTPAPDAIVSLPNSITIHEQIGGSTNPNISDFVYAGEIPNGSWVAIGFHVTGIDPTMGQTLPIWGAVGFDSNTSPSTIIINDASRKRITCTINSSRPVATVTDL
jgi:hypothetical protein